MWSAVRIEERGREARLSVGMGVAVRARCPAHRGSPRRPVLSTRAQAGLTGTSVPVPGCPVRK